ncbi:hypothetical protein N7492_002936 [Penicillium capsulatum]|uniref:Uncharacterized protein n=1 Tax=Penicillium capsulatum TaxID=69766 RepID=A0A9W9LVM4_9EURO|nr:hypothetical protein N7492_002936 [Penicillium capsulatum]KAJ6122470.1 hypothetical protein N7512_004935 [Penicillium capsulatum]
MDTNAVIDFVHEIQGQVWVDTVNETHRTGRLCQWVSTFHPNKLSCQLDGSFHHSAFNAGMKMVFSDRTVFSDSTAWMARFPRVGIVSDDHTDEKVAMEVAALGLIRNNTTIPVLRVRLWGSAASDSLGLCPFIMMDFIDGLSESDYLWPVNSSWDCKGDELPKITGRYCKYLEIFIRVLEEEEAKMLAHKEKELSSLIKWSQIAGAIWPHILLSTGFNDYRSFPFTQLRQNLGATEWSRRASEFDNVKELEEFATRKLSELDQYDEAVEKTEDKALVDSGNMTKEQFIARCSELLSTQYYNS